MIYFISPVNFMTVHGTYHAVPMAVLDAGRENIENVQDLNFAYPRATPERALLDWIYLGASVRSRLSLPPFDIQMHQMNQPRLKRLTRAMGIARQWAEWHERWKNYQGAEDVRQNASEVLSFQRQRGQINRVRKLRNGMRAQS